MFSEICHFYPGYTRERLTREPLPWVYHLYARIPDIRRQEAR